MFYNVMEGNAMSTMRSITISFLPEVFDLLEQEANAKGIPISIFLRSIIMEKKNGSIPNPGPSANSNSIVSHKSSYVIPKRKFCAGCNTDPPKKEFGDYCCKSCAEKAKFDLGQEMPF